ncbi:hypothetical protein L1887_29163 [Cichorium endivia]|nr:hypothetical protein L1887_29163 [Cichorium endivia]
MVCYGPHGARFCDPDCDRSSFSLRLPKSDSRPNLVIADDKQPPRGPMELQHKDLPERPIWQIIMVIANCSPSLKEQ